MQLEENKLEQYQLDIKQGAREGFALGHKWLFVQAPTRSGKTVIFSDITNDFVLKCDDKAIQGKADENFKNDVLIVVHERKIMNQIVKTLKIWHSIHAIKVTSKVKEITQRNNLFTGYERTRVYVAMSKTLMNRMNLESFKIEMRNVGLLIADEAHLGLFKRVFKHELFADILRLGFSATPKASGKEPLYPEFFTYIVVGPSVKDLIEVNKINPARGVLPQYTHVLDQIPDKEKFREGKDGDYDQDQVGEEMSGKRQIGNTINAIITRAYGKRLLVFCANKQHSKDFTVAANIAGLNCRHMDSDSSEEWQDETLAWFEKTPGAILSNVRMTTIGFDAPWCDGTVLNTLTKSITLDKQMRARSQTPMKYPNGGFKTHGICLDMCNNTALHGEFQDDVDWKKVFYEPKYWKPGIAPKKKCKSCDGINSASARVCVVCDEPFDFDAPTVDTVSKSMILISKDIDIETTVNAFSSRGEYSAMYDILRQTAWLAKKKIMLSEGLEDAIEFSYVVEQDDFDQIFLEAQSKIREWREYIGKKKIEIDFESIRASMQKNLEEYGFVLNCQLAGEGIYTGKKTKAI